MGLIIETFVHNYLLRENGELYFWRQRQIKEVDFIQVSEAPNRSEISK